VIVHLVRSVDEFVPLREEWNRLADRLRSPLLWHEWFLSAARTLHVEGDLRIAVLRSGERLTAAAPLAVRPGAGSRRLELLGSYALGEPGGLLYEDEAALKALLRRVRSLGTPLTLARLAAPSIARRDWQRTIGPAVVLRIETAPSLTLPLRGEWERFLASRSQRLRYDLRRAGRRADSAGAVVVEAVSPQPHEVDALFDRFVAVEAAGWKGRRGAALLRCDALRAFFLGFCRAAAARGALRTMFVRIGGEVAAAALTIEAYGRVWALKIAFDERWARCSPGLLLTREAIADALGRGMAAYEFLGSAEPWEERWDPDVRQHATVLVYPSTASGMAALAADVCRGAISRVGRLARAVASRSGGESR